jgi:hypothetical protein
MSRRGAILAQAALKQMLAPSGSVLKSRYEAHLAFDKVWKSGRMTRSQAYAWMQQALNLPPHEAHISLFSCEQCAALLKAIEKGEK